MKIDVQKSFEKDIEKIKDNDVALSVLTLIADIEGYTAPSQISHLKKNVWQ